MKKSLIIIFILVSLFSSFRTLFSQNYDAEIMIDTKHVLAGEITRSMFGGFIEVVLGKVNGSLGYYGQDIYNRGFDMDDWGFGQSTYWFGWYSDYNSALPEWEVKEGGVNPNGKYYQRIIKRGKGGSAGITQNVYLTSSISSDFYISIRGDSSVGDVFLSFRDSTDVVSYYQTNLGKPDSNWKKVSAVIPPINKDCMVKLVISYNGIGNVDLDEASLMPQNIGSGGIRSEYLKLFKNWSPGIIRFPGGWFADRDFVHWQYAIGPIDERKSPIHDYGNTNQRLDFGVDEFVKFCRSIGAEPHFTINFENGTPEEAASWVEYCNGPVESKFGALRAKYGNPEPFKVKYWEIGNEQWNNPDEMSKRYLLFYQSMKAVDSTINIIIDGNYWGSDDYFNVVFNNVGNKCQVYGWHSAFCCTSSDKIDSDLIYLGIVSVSKDCERYISRIEEKLAERNLSSTTIQANTEYSTCFDSDWYNHPRLNCLETGLCTASNVNVNIRHPSSDRFSERTITSGIFVSGYNTNGKRIIDASPSLYVLSMFSNHFGNLAIPVNFISDTYSNPQIDGIMWTQDVPWIDASASLSKDTLFLYVLNRHPNYSLTTKLTYSVIPLPTKIKIYELKSGSYLDTNTVNNPKKIVPVESIIDTPALYNFPPHSFTIFAIPYENLIGLDTIFNNNKDIEVQSYPNPFDNEILLSFSNPLTRESYVFLYDMLGNKILKQELPYNSTYSRVNTDKISNGFYILRIQSGNVIKQRYMIK